LDYVSIISQELLFVLTLERLINCYSLIYSSLIRTLFLEFYRILNHCLAITTHSIDLGLVLPLLWSFEEREKLIELTEAVSGTRFHSVFILLGRLRYDISLRWIISLIDWLLHFIRSLREIHYILSLNSLFKSRLHEIGIIERNFCLYFGSSGVIARSSSIFCDGRITGYEFYCSIDYYLFLSFTGDCLDRYLTRLNEIMESCRIIYAILYLFFTNSFFYLFFNTEFSSVFNSSLRSVFISSFIRLSLSLDLLSSSYSLLKSSITLEYIISDFLILSWSYLNFSLKLSIESAKGLYSIFLFFYSTNIITNDFLSLFQINKFCRSIILGDLIAILGSFDFVLGSVDLYVYFSL